MNARQEREELVARLKTSGVGLTFDGEATVEGVRRTKELVAQVDARRVRLSTARLGLYSKADR